MMRRRTAKRGKKIELQWSSLKDRREKLNVEWVVPGLTRLMVDIVSNLYHTTPLGWKLDMDYGNNKAT